MLANRNDESKDSLCLAFWGYVQVHETLIQDETVADTEEHLAMFCLSLHSEALLEKGVPLWKWCAHLGHVARAASTSWASSQSTMCMGSSFVTCTLASWFKRSCSSKSSSLALASLWSVAPTIASSRRNWTVSQLWLMGTRHTSGTLT